MPTTRTDARSVKTYLTCGYFERRAESDGSHDTAIAVSMRRYISAVSTTRSFGCRPIGATCETEPWPNRPRRSDT